MTTGKESFQYGVVELSDVKIVLKGVTFYAHKSVLANACNYFASMFTMDLKCEMVPLPENFKHSAADFALFLDMLYAKPGAVLNFNTVSVLAMVELAFYFDCPTASAQASAYLQANQAKVFANRPVLDILTFAQNHKMSTEFTDKLMIEYLQQQRIRGVKPRTVAEYEKELAHLQRPTVLRMLAMSLSGVESLFRADLKIGDYVDLRDTSNKWLVATITDDQNDKFFVHYEGFESRWDEWIPHDSQRIMPLGSRSNKPNPPSF